jgi:hypothetical protein
MTWLQRLWARNTRCRIDSHKVDWVYFYAFGDRQCLHCEHPMPEPHRSTHPDSGD